MAALLFTTILTTYFLVSDRFARLEVKETAAQVERVCRAFQQSLDTLATVAGDWAPWDDTYRFVRDLNPAYVENNLVDTTFTNLRLNFMLFYNSRRELVYSRFYASDPDQPEVHPDDVISAIAAQQGLMSLTGAHDRVGGILRTSTFPLMVSAHPIVTSEFKGPVRGVLILGRILDDQEIGKIQDVVKTDFNIHYDPELAGLKKARSAVLSGLRNADKGIYVVPMDARSIIGYGQVADLTGQGPLILEIPMHREIYQYGLMIWRQNTMAIFALGLSFVVLLVVLMNRFILGPIAGLAQQVIELNRSADKNGRIDVQSNDEIGQLAGHINTMLDTFESVLQENEQYAREVLDSINCGVMVVDAQQRRIVDVNVTGAALFKRAPKDIIGQMCHRLVCPKEMGNCPVIDHHQAIDLSERKLLKPDGTTLPILKSVKHTERKGRQYLIESFMDISSLKKAEADLRRSEERYRRFFNEDITGDFLSSRDGSIIECNPAFARMFGYESVEEIKSVNTKLFYPSEEIRTRLLERLQSAGKLEQEKMILVRRDKSPLHGMANLFAKFDDNGAFKEISGYILDDTQRVLLENDLRQAHKMEAIGTLAGGIAHDFNNILSGIVGYTEIARSHLPSSGEAAQRLGQALRAANRAKALVQQILAFSRQSESNHQPIEIIPSIEDVIKLMRASLPSTIEIVSDFKSNATVVADPVQIHQVMLNLCANSGHAMKKAGGRLCVGVEDMILAQSFTDHHPGMAPGEYVRIAVQDTGEGIAPGIINRIFDPFFTTKANGEGTGMGLSVVHGIVTKIGGAITVSSSPEGTCFEIYLPRSQPAAVEADNAMQSEPPMGKERVVFIDDEEFLVDIGTQMLEQLGYRVTGFVSSSQAMDYIFENADSVDLVITDMTMPQLTGLALARRLLAKLPRLKIILCTGYSEEISSEDDVRAMGIGGLIIKPVQINDLARKIRHVLDMGPSVPSEPVRKASQ